MLLAEIKSLFHKELGVLYPKEEIDSFFYQMLEHYLNLERFILLIRPDFVVTKAEEQPFFEALARLKKEEPIQHILGQAHFMDLKFIVNKNVLIPRPETEELVSWILSDHDKQDSALKILDIGTGSGCIAIALAKKLSNATMYALDISVEALKIAEENATSHGVEIKFITADITDKGLNLENLDFDVIVANPPYVRELEKQAMQNNVKKYEPKQALYVTDDNPLKFYSAITDFAMEHLKQNGQLYFEINQYLALETEELLQNKGFDKVELRKDIFGNFRMLKGVKK